MSAKEPTANGVHRKTSLPTTRLRKLSVQGREHCELRCCRIHVLLVVMQSCLGLAVTGLGIYMKTLTSTLMLRERPFWAGIPLLFAGVAGIYFCVTDFTAYLGSIRAFVVKASCFILSAICIFVCMIGAVFAGIHGSRISGFSHCSLNSSLAECSCATDASPVLFVYADITRSCDVIATSIKDYLILQCALNSIGSGVCLWLVTLLWKAKYQGFHSGLRFYSYSASVPAHPWSDPSHPPYPMTSPCHSPRQIEAQSEGPGERRSRERSLRQTSIT